MGEPETSVETYARIIQKIRQQRKAQKHLALTTLGPFSQPYPQGRRLAGTADMGACIAGTGSRSTAGTSAAGGGGQGLNGLAAMATLEPGAGCVPRALRIAASRSTVAGRQD